MRPEFGVIAHSADRSKGCVKFVSAPRDLPIKLELLDTAQLSGTVVDGKGNRLGGIELVQFFEFSKQDRIDYASTRSDENGEFVMTGILPNIRQKLAVKTGLGRFEFVGSVTTYSPGESQTGLKVKWIDRTSSRIAKSPFSLSKPIDLEFELSWLSRTVKLADMRGLVIIHDHSEAGLTLAKNISNLDDEKRGYDREIVSYLLRTYQSEKLLQNDENRLTVDKRLLQLPGNDQVTLAVIDGDEKLLRCYS